jgi:hypothetical protein
MLLGIETVPNVGDVQDDDRIRKFYVNQEKTQALLYYCVRGNVHPEDPWAWIGFSEDGRVKSIPDDLPEDKAEQVRVLHWASVI